MFEELDDPSPQLRAADALPGVQARGQVLRRRRRAAAASGAGVTTALVVALALVLPGDGSTGESLVPAGPSPSTSGPSTSGPSPTSVAPPVTPAPSSPAPTPLPSASATRSTPTRAVAPPTAAPTSEPATSPRATSAPSTPRPGRSTQPPATTPSTAPPPSASPEPRAPGVLLLGGDDLGVTALGAARTQAVAAVRAVLGAPAADPATTVGCVDAQQEVAWPGFRLGFDAADRLTGWSSTSRALATPSGVSVGTTVERLEQVYGDRLQLFASETESGVTYTVDGVAILGSLSGTAPSDRVVALRNGSCTGP